MKISEKQLHILVITLYDSLRTHDCRTHDCSNIFAYDRETRLDLYHMIVAQQDDALRDVEGLDDDVQDWLPIHGVE